MEEFKELSDALNVYLQNHEIDESDQLEDLLKRVDESDITFEIAKSVGVAKYLLQIAKHKQQNSNVMNARQILIKFRNTKPTLEIYPPLLSEIDVYIPQREVFINLLVKKIETNLSKFYTFSKEDLNICIKALEKEVFEFHGGFVSEAYNIQTRGLTHVLPKNIPLVVDFLKGNLTSASIVTKDVKELLTEDERKTLEAIKKKVEENSMFREFSNMATTDQEPCPRCKSRNVRFEEKQTRSADEPMTVTYQCQECNKRWRR
eukprot:TRINITY_DN2811_c0_g1_i1.p2 TRINITY_DN2811_c0_g1~~TRINITY_DN2811_c0_g1_i1.p2  ORF type:complete len:261 (-),score=85.22 TRINITY_DN2811_c0_g1_i1:1274-2056(-)